MSVLQAQPPGTFMAVGSATAYLNSFRLPLTVSHATSYLRSLWHSFNLLALYRHYFPVEFGASTASCDLEITYSGSGEPTCLYNPKEREFLQLVDQRLFPYYADHLLDEEEEREDLIYLPSFGVDWWSIEFDELERGWQLLLCITGTAQQDCGVKVEECFDLEVRAALLGIRRDKVVWDMLAVMCNGKSEPLSFLPVALDMLEHDTGNIFLDPTDETPADPLEWSIEDIDFLVAQYKEASLISEKVSNLLDWLTASPVHLREVITLWNECQQPLTNPNPRS